MHLLINKTLYVINNQMFITFSPNPKLYFRFFLYLSENAYR